MKRSKNVDNVDTMEALAKCIHGIYLITTSHNGSINGMIASWVTQVSYDPFLILAAVHPNRRTHPLVTKSGHFVLHILARDQRDMIRQFKAPEPEVKFRDIPWQEGRTGCPILRTCIGYLECKVAETHTPGNHCLFIGEVIHAKCLSSTKTPLSTLDYEGVYTGRQ